MRHDRASVQMMRAVADLQALRLMARQRVVRDELRRLTDLDSQSSELEREQQGRRAQWSAVQAKRSLSPELSAAWAGAILRGERDALTLQDQRADAEQALDMARADARVAQARQDASDQMVEDARIHERALRESRALQRLEDEWRGPAA